MADPEWDKIRDRGFAMMDKIKAVHGEGDLFFRAMAVMVKQMEEYQQRRSVRPNSQ